MTSSNRTQTKQELQTLLKEKYGINKNISASLSVPECHRLLQLLRDETSVSNLTDSFIAKNDELANNNRNLGQRRSLAERKRDRTLAELQALQDQNAELNQSVQTLTQNNSSLEEYKRQLTEQNKDLERDVADLLEGHQHLKTTVVDLSAKNKELSSANEGLMRDNKELKNVVDQIRLRLAQDTKMLLQYEDSEIRKALIRLFRWTLG